MIQIFTLNHLTYFKYRKLLTEKILRKVQKWLEANRLALNIDKTNFVIFHSQWCKIKDHIVLRFGWKSIKQEAYVKFLGILLNSNLSWKFHLTELFKKLARTAGLFYKICHYVPTDRLMLLYHGLFVSSLTYGISVWAELIAPILILFSYFKMILKIITLNEVTASSAPLFDTLQILKLNDLFKSQVTSFVYECLNSLASIYFGKYLVSIHSVHSIGTRQLKKVIYLLCVVIKLNMVPTSIF